MKKFIIISALVFAVNNAYTQSWADRDCGEPTGSHFNVSQEMLNKYRSAHPNFNFPHCVDEIIERQAEQILNYFHRNYRFNEINNRHIHQILWTLFKEMPFAKFESAVNDTINRFYHFGRHFEGEEWRRKYQVEFGAPFGSRATISRLNVHGNENIQKMIDLLQEIEH
ncbi:MAG: hypothetical protein FWE17_01090 [Alphaproteobacteria bacterium]|nr:hypothetical protein [Alphaproteobacteria bacterium]MCL2758532.1 hypothetical protein [Alphaproteobacteria bacterium]